MKSRFSITAWLLIGVAAPICGSSATALEPVVAPGATGPISAASNALAPHAYSVTHELAPHSAGAGSVSSSPLGGGTIVEGSSLEHVPAGITSGDCQDCNIGYGSSVTVGPELAKLQFYLDLLILTRGDADDTDLLFDSVTGDPLLSVGDLTSGAHTGLRIGAIFYDEGGRDIEFSVIAMDEFGEPVTRTNDNPMVFPFFGGVPADPQTTYTLDYASTLNSGEINLRQRYGSRISWIAGLRFIELNERFNVLSGNGQFASDVDNDLYGFQLGGEMCLGTVRRSLFVASVKGGVYYNNSDVSATATSGTSIVNFIDDEDEVAFVGDVSIGMLIPMGPQADLRIGYQGLFLDGVGLAPDQSDDFSLFTRSGSLDKSTVLYHGGYIGFDIFW